MGRLYLMVSVVLFCHQQMLEAALMLDLGTQTWSLVNNNRSVDLRGVKVPGGVYSDLKDVVLNNGDILYRFNDLQYRWVGYQDWTYTTRFNITESQMANKEIDLVLHGVDTVATLFINGQTIGNTSNMFVRYKYPVKQHLKVGNNQLDVALVSPINEGTRIAQSLPYVIPVECWPKSYRGECHINKLRKMQASFGWDWGPAFPSLGIWKKVVLEMRNEGSMIRSVGVVTRKVEGCCWRVIVRCWFDVEDLSSIRPGELTASLFIDTRQPPISKRITVTPTFVNTHLEARISLTVPANRVELWWPNGYGQQKLYRLTVSFKSADEISSKQLKIGFRDIQLLQEPVSQDPNKGLTFYFKVNGLGIFAKGSNWIPSHVLPEHSAEPSRIKTLLSSAKQAHFNMLRVWGGGLYESDLFYEVCDELGIMVWQDMMFACNMYPSSKEFLESVKLEIQQQVDRLQYHPSIALWAANNENEVALSTNWYGTATNFSLYKQDYIKLYVETVRSTVKLSDGTRAFLTSSPSNGIRSEQEGYVASNPQDSRYGDVHYYNNVADGWSWLIYPKTRFASEYGVQSLPSIHTLAQAALPADLVLDSDFLKHRQHQPAGYEYLNIQLRTNLPPFNNLETLIYFSQINQAMRVKTETETYRREMSQLYSTGEGMTMGALYWQLNDIWQAPSWSSIDYSGSWKMLHYYARDFFAPVITSPVLTADHQLSVTIVSELLKKVPSAQLKVLFYKFGSKQFTPAVSYTYNVSIASSSSVEVLRRNVKEMMGEACPNDNSCFIMTQLYNSHQNTPLSPYNFLFMAKLYEVQLPDPNITITKVNLITEYSAVVRLKSECVALFVWLEVANMSGTFSKNGFHMTEPTTQVNFTSYQPINLNNFISALTVTSLKSKYN